jgi:signal transduction histidine kinase
VIYIYFISQTLFQYRLLDLKELLGKMVTLSILVLILTVLYGALLIWVGSDQPGVFFFNTLVASFIILVLSEPLRNWVEDRVTRWLFREKYEFSRRMRLLSADLVNIIEVRPLTSHILRELEISERITHASIYLADSSGSRFQLAGHVGPRPPETLDVFKRRLLFERLRQESWLSLEALERELGSEDGEKDDDAVASARNVLSSLKDLHAGVSFALSTDEQLLGMLNINDERLREAYASDELEQLRQLAAQAAITLKNSKVYEELKERDRLAALGQMAAGLAHEIRNPLGAIKGAAQLLGSQHPDGSHVEGPLEERKEDDQMEYLQIIVEEVDRLSHVVSQFLGYARPDRGERQMVEINDVVRRTVQLLPPAKDSAVQLLTDLAPELPPISANGEQLQQVFLNLGLNGLQSLEGRGQLTIRTRARRKPLRGRIAPVIEVAFEDSGRGMDADSLTSIFIPFYTTKEGGTGLGLPICQRIVENHLGNIEVHSELGKGSTFTVTLPVLEVLGSRIPDGPSATASA